VTSSKALKISSILFFAPFEDMVYLSFGLSWRENRMEMVSISFTNVKERRPGEEMTAGKTAGPRGFGRTPGAEQKRIIF
jgi:hypothetical protein